MTNPSLAPLGAWVKLGANNAFAHFIVAPKRPACGSPSLGVEPVMRLGRQVLFGLLAATTVVGACSKIDGQNSPSQVAARVNSEEITVHQINYVLAREPGITAANADRAKRGILSRLINQELAKQQAIEAKLDRTPDVLQALEFARREILARAYLTRLAAAEAQPTPKEIAQYYSEHPELFGRRHLYQMEEIAASPKGDVARALREVVAAAKSMAQVAGWLRSRSVAFTESRGTRGAEQVPLDMLPALQSMKEGEIRVVPVRGEELRVVHLVASKLSPISESAAAPRIRLFLTNRRASAAIAKEMKRLRKQASIEYVGEFANDGAKLGEADAKTGDASGAEQQDAQHGSADADPAEKDADRGIRGLFNN